jgi:hypothetical protein
MTTNERLFAEPAAAAENESARCRGKSTRPIERLGVCTCCRAETSTEQHAMDTAEGNFRDESFEVENLSRRRPYDLQSASFVRAICVTLMAPAATDR